MGHLLADCLCVVNGESANSLAVLAAAFVPVLFPLPTAVVVEIALPRRPAAITAPNIRSLRLVGLSAEQLLNVKLVLS